MNPDPVYQRLREIGWRRPLTETEQAELHAWLAVHPEHQTEADADAVLSQALAKLPDAPVPSNFTTRVLAALEHEVANADRVPVKVATAWWRVLIPRIAVVTVVVGVSGLAYRHHQTVKREELAKVAKSLVTVASVAPLSDLTMLADFEAIRSMGQADESLLALSDDLLSLKP